MNYTILITAAYERRAKKFLKRHPELTRQYLKTLELIETNPLHPSLRLHPLRGHLTGLHSVSINLSYRITLEVLITETTIIPVDIGDHDQVY